MELGDTVIKLLLNFFIINTLYAGQVSLHISFYITRANAHLCYSLLVFDGGH